MRLVFGGHMLAGLVGTTNIIARPVRMLYPLISLVVVVSSTLMCKIFSFCSQASHRIRLDDGG
jgi:hypothetical protein